MYTMCFSSLHCAIFSLKVKGCQSVITPKCCYCQGNLVCTTLPPTFISPPFLSSSYNALHILSPLLILPVPSLLFPSPHIRSPQPGQQPTITTNGFQFLLLERSSQVWYFMLQHLNTVEVSQTLNSLAAHPPVEYDCHV